MINKKYRYILIEFVDMIGRGSRCLKWAGSREIIFLRKNAILIL